MGRRFAAISVALALPAALAACASGEAATSATSAIAVAGDAIARARTDGALQSAPLPLHEAEQKLQAAQQAQAHDNHKEADRLAIEAKADADLADMTSRAAHAEKAAATVREDAGALRMQGSTTPAPIPSGAPGR